MPETKQIRVSELVHGELQKEKSEDETFDDVLRELLDLTPTLDDLLAYYSDEQADVARELVQAIEDAGDVARDVGTSGASEVIEFSSVKNGRTIAALTFEEKPSKSSVIVSYRNQSGDMEQLGSVRQNAGEEMTGAILGEYGTFDDPAELVEVVRQRAQDAYEAWG